MLFRAVGQNRSNAPLSRIPRFRSSLLPALAAISIAFSSPTSYSQAVQTGGTPPPEPSRVDIFAGYSYFHPFSGSIGGVAYQPINPGAIASVTGYFNRYIGIQAEGSFFPNGPNDCVFTGQAGPVARFQHGRLVPFVHVLGGGAKVGGPIFQGCTWGWGVTAGGGIDYILPAFHNHLALRLAQADYMYSHVDYGTPQLGGIVGGTAAIDAYRLSAGLVLRFGQTAYPQPVQLGCTLQPVNVYAGDPITVSAAPANLNPRRKAAYTWTSNGGKLTPHDESASIDTAGLAPGDYTVTGHVTQGPRPGEQATCSTGFRVHEFEPPAITCSANPGTIQTGESSTITSIGTSPQNRQLTYAYSASAGIISGNTPQVTLVASGAPSGVINVTCTVIDDLGKQASAQTTVTVVSPPPPTPQPKPLCRLSFERDHKRPVRVDNEAKGCLDEIALTLNRDTVSKLVIVGHHSTDESPDSAAQRTLNVELYLTKEKGIDPSRLELRTGGEMSRSVDDTLVPPGATFAPGDTQTFDPNSIQRPTGQPYAPNRPPKQ